MEFAFTLRGKIWKTNYGGEAAKRCWRLSRHSKPRDIIRAARRDYSLRLISESHLDGSDSLSLGHRVLIADLARTLITEVGRRAKPHRGTYQLYRLLANRFATPRTGTCPHNSARRTTPGVNSTDRFNAAFPALPATIEGDGRPNSNGGAAFHLRNARNQVQHHMHYGLEVYQRTDPARFTADALLTLFRVDSWAI